MRLFRRPLLVCALLALCASFSLNAVAAEPLRAAFWNIQWFPGGRPNPSEAEETRQIDAIHREITRLNADVIGLAEIRDWESVALAVKPLPGFKVDVCSTFPAREGQRAAQQVAIASRLQPMSAWVEEWNTDGPIVPPRGFAFAAYQLAPARVLLVYALHLKSNRGELVENVAIREESMRQLLVHMKDMEAAYGKLGRVTWLVTGDFNTDPTDTRFAKERTTRDLVGNGFRWIFENMPLTQRVTLPPDARFPAANFDHIFYRGAKLRKAEALVTPATASDHRPVRAEFDLD
ncbi:hypothetical protein BH20VER1_BH20VER1_22690 [soil metagenome]